MDSHRHHRRTRVSRRVERAVAINEPAENESLFLTNGTNRAVAGSTASHRSNLSYPPPLAHADNPQQASADRRTSPALTQRHLVQHQHHMQRLWGNPDSAQQMRQDRSAQTMSAMRSLNAESHLPEHVVDEMCTNSEGMLPLDRYVAGRDRDGYHLGMRRRNRDVVAMDGAADISLEGGPVSVDDYPLYLAARAKRWVPGWGETAQPRRCCDGQRY
ncbi:hypothetical protein VTN77DRAFT_6655 [Rasamsonia byssochlamydoides]|uniref:uncharacterized protein n=1 Tax=Rasamsonia byssochlamydoides TaxID=89139 RepID=UPI003743EA87